MSRLPCQCCMKEIQVNRVGERNESPTCIDMIFKCFSIQMAPTETYRIVCIECIGRLKASYAFKMLIQETQWTLKQNSTLWKDASSEDDHDNEEIDMLEKSLPILKKRIKQTPIRANIFNNQYESSKDVTDKSFICRLCDKSFRRNNELIIHLCHRDKVLEKVAISKILTKKINKEVLDDKIDSMPRRSPKNRKITVTIKKRKLNGNKRSDDGDKFECDDRSKTKKLQCNVEGCTEMFDDRVARLYHTRDAHDVDIYKYECDACGMKFCMKGRLSMHVKRTHQRVLNFTCDVCGRSLFSMYHLRRHMLTHNGEKNFKCTVCSKAFTRKNTLTAHMAIHDSYKALKCPECDEGFTYKVSLKGHLSRVHGQSLDRVVKGAIKKH